MEHGGDETLLTFWMSGSDREGRVKPLRNSSLGEVPKDDARKVMGLEVGRRRRREVQSFDWKILKICLSKRVSKDFV